MKLSTNLARCGTAALLAAGMLALAGCGEEPQPKPAPKVAPPPPPTAAAKPEAPAQPAASAARAADDAALDARVKSALSAVQGLNTHRIDVVVKDGVVTLFGTTESPALRDAAGKAVAGLPGVKSVQNSLAIVAGS